MAASSLANRVAALEEEVAQLKARLEKLAPSSSSWVDKIAGTFANDPAYEEAMRLGREWRESQHDEPHGETP